MYLPQALLLLAIASMASAAPTNQPPLTAGEVGEMMSCESLAASHHASCAMQCEEKKSSKAEATCITGW